MKRIKAKGIEVIVYEPELGEPSFFNSCVETDFSLFKDSVDIILANHGSRAGTCIRQSTAAICLEQIKVENNKQKVALVTGAAGFIGYHISKRLLDENYELWASIVCPITTAFR